MSEPTNENEAVEEGGGKGKLIIIIGLVVALLAVGGGAGYYIMFMSGSADNTEASAKDSKKKKSKKSKQKDSSSKDTEDDEPAGDADRSLQGALQDDEGVKTVVELQPFIVNLADLEEARYLRMTVSLGIGGDDGADHEPDPIFLAKVKNAMLAILSVKKSEDVLTVDGKAKLRKQLLEAAQSADEDGHVEAIYITDFIVQL